MFSSSFFLNVVSVPNLFQFSLFQLPLKILFSANVIAIKCLSTLPSIYKHRISPTFSLNSNLSKNMISFLFSWILAQ